MKRGDDAADHAPRPNEGIDDKTPKTAEKQDAPNYETTDGGRAIERGEVNSANDE